MESDLHKFLKLRASSWLKSKGCLDIRYEQTVLMGTKRIDVIGFRDNVPVIGIECGSIKDNWGYELLDFPVFQLGYLPEPKDWKWKTEPFMGRPHKRLGRFKKPKHYFHEKVKTWLELYREYNENAYQSAKRSGLPIPPDIVPDSLKEMPGSVVSFPSKDQAHG